MGILKLQEQAKSDFFKLLKKREKEHFRKTVAKNVEFWSAWDYDNERDVAINHIHSATYGYGIVEVEPDGSYVILVTPTGASSGQVAQMAVDSVKGALKRLRDWDKKKSGGGFKWGYCMKHKCGKKALERLNEAVTKGLICSDFKNALEGMDIGMSYTP